uniref:Uncharacterized protein n=1 Tax=Populus davidiana TaxID=266767 RepID=A0A6M2F597_9ROSI
MAEEASSPICSWQMLADASWSRRRPLLLFGPSGRLNHHQRQSQPSTWAIQEALPKKNGPPYKGAPNNMQGPQRKGSTAYDISSLQEQISHLRQKVQMAKALTSLKLNIGPPSIT